MEEIKKRIYLSGPISGYDLSERRSAFSERQLLLESVGFEVFNPLCNGLPSTATTNEHMRADLENLLSCDAIYFMSRWTHSAGCLTELHVATAIGLEVYFEECYVIDDFKPMRFK